MGLSITIVHLNFGSHKIDINGCIMLYMNIFISILVSYIQALTDSSVYVTFVDYHTILDHFIGVNAFGI